MTWEWHAIRVPQGGANETQAKITQWYHPSGAHIAAAVPVASIETSKSILDIESPVSGYLYRLVNEGEQADVGRIIGVVTPQPVTAAQIAEWVAKCVAAIPQKLPAEDAGHRRATRKAQLLADRHGVDLSRIRVTTLPITESDVLAYLAEREKSDALRAARPVNVPVDNVASRPQRLLILGGGDGALLILDALRENPLQTAVAILDNNPQLQGLSIGGVRVVGKIDPVLALKWQEEGHTDAAIISLGMDIPFRRETFDSWSRLGVRFANVIHPSVIIGQHVSIGTGNVILAGCRLGTYCTIGDNNFLSAGCSLDHHCRLGSHCTFGPSVVTSGRVTIGNQVRFGTGIFIQPHLSIGDEATIASGAVIVTDVPSHTAVKVVSRQMMRHIGDPTV